MNEEIKNFIRRIANNVGNQFSEEAEELLEKEFEKDTVKTFNYYIENRPQSIRAIKTKIDLVKIAMYGDEEVNFILENWDNMDKIINILKENVKEEENEQINN